MCAEFLTHVIMTVQIDTITKLSSLPMKTDENPDSQIVHYSSVELRGHSLLCFTGELNAALHVLQIPR